jgi:dephospho-CoA kinase
MIKIGLTGGIGSGKTTISKIFQILGAPVYYADDRSKFLLNSVPELINAVIKLFGKNAYDNNILNRKYIASVAFTDAEMLNKLNQIIHPAVEKDFIDWCSLHSQKKYIIKEAAILFESNAYRLMDKNILITAPIETRIIRVIARDGSSRNEVEKRMVNQWPAEKLIPLADYVICNDDKTLILPQIIDIDKKIRIEWQNLVNG